MKTYTAPELPIDANPYWRKAKSLDQHLFELDLGFNFKKIICAYDAKNKSLPRQTSFLKTDNPVYDIYLQHELFASWHCSIPKQGDLVAPYLYNAVVNRVKDGDTLVVTLDLGFGISFTIDMRLEGIDTPETYRAKTDGEYQHGREAKEFLINYLEANRNQVMLQSIKSPTTHKYLTTFNRYRCHCWVKESNGYVAIAQTLRENGFAKRDHYKD